MFTSYCGRGQFGLDMLKRMHCSTKMRWLALAAVAIIFIGCGEQSQNNNPYANSSLGDCKLSNVRYLLPNVENRLVLKHYITHSAEFKDPQYVDMYSTSDSLWVHFDSTHSKLLIIEAVDSMSKYRIHFFDSSCKLIGIISGDVFEGNSNVRVEQFKDVDSGLLMLSGQTMLGNYSDSIMRNIYCLVDTSCYPLYPRLNAYYPGYVRDRIVSAVNRFNTKSP